MPSEPVQHNGAWWVQQDDGIWIRWDETSGIWVRPDGSIAGPASTATVAVAAQQAFAARPDQRKRRFDKLLYAVVGAAVLGIIAIVGFTLVPRGNNGGSDSDAGSEGSALGGTQGAGAAAAALNPMACEHTGSGKAFEVGPGKELDSLGKVPWDALVSGDTVLIHYRPEPYREKFLLRGQGTEAQPITVCGVAGPGGELPIIDGQNAVGVKALAYPFSGNGEPRGLITITLGAADQWGYKPQYLVIQGLHIRNAFNENSFTASNGKASKYADNASGIFIERGEHIIVRGVVLEGNGNGFFVASGDSEEVLSRDILLERSRIYGNGTVKVAPDRHHNIYTEASGMVFQFNDVGPLREGSGGAALKDRSAGTVVRYNRIEGGSRTLDLVDAQESSTMQKDVPAYRTTLVYGNILIAGPVGSSNMIHYGGDSGIPEITRQGTLYFYNNTVVVRANQTGPNARYRTALFDATSSSETIDARNNVIDVRAALPGSPPTELTWMRNEGNLKLGVNWVSPVIQQWREDKAPASGRITGLDKVIGEGNADPVFTNEAGGDYTLASGSGAVGVAGALHEIPVGLKATVDFEYVHPAAGKPRSTNTEMGAYSGAPSSSAAASAASTSSGSSASSAKAGPTLSGSAKADGWIGPLQYLGKGPNGYDSGLKSACTGATAGSPSVICVRAGAGSGGTGTAGAPFASINAALAVATPKDVIQVAVGTYSENVAIGTEINALVQTEITLLGGFSPDFTSRNASQFRSVIDGKGGAPAVQFHLQSNGKTVLDGFRITGGKGLGNNSENGNGRGGGIFVEILGNGEVLLSHNEIYGNQTSKLEDEQRGGGIHTDGQDYDGSKPVIRIEDNVIHNNQAGRAAGINVTGRQATILRNVVEANRAHSDHGGGIYVSTESAAEVADNVVRGNEIGATVKYGYGGGIIIAAAPAELHGNIVAGNYAPTNGSGVFWDEGAKGTMREDLIFANSCPSEARSGTALYVDGGAAPSVVALDHVTIAGHNCPFEAPNGAAILVEASSKVTIKDSILWNNSREFQTLDKGSFTIQNSITSVAGSGNKSTDPQFVDPAAGNFRLKAGSGAIGVASNKTNVGAYPK